MNILHFPFNTRSFCAQHTFFWWMNTSVSPTLKMYFLDAEIELKNKERLDWIRSFIDELHATRRSSSLRKFEDVLQVVNAVPVIGTLTSLVTTLIYCLLRAIESGHMDVLVEKLIPEDPETAQRLCNFIFEHLNADEGFPQMNPKEIVELVLDKKMEDIEKCTQEERKTFERIMSSLQEMDVGEQYIKIFQSQLRVLWFTNQTMRSALGIIPCVKPVIRLIQTL